MRLRVFAWLFLLAIIPPPSSAGPKHFIKGIGSQFKRTFYTDVKQHPFAWGIPLALQWAIAFSDTGSSCRAEGSMIESGPAHYFIGRSPNCHKFVMLSLGAMTIHSMSENWLANSIKESCDREAANPDSRWWKTPSHTKSTNACYWALPLGDTAALAAYEIPTIKRNVELAQ